ncbi:MAG: thermonuclease family protein [Phycisphaerales bacterium]|nr:thermonuclease family protein [Phycisphaerales bacterium]
MTRVVDGDTIVVVGRDEIEQTVRLAEIDAPEKDQPSGQEATQFVQGLLEGKIVQLENVGREKFGRILAQVYLDSRRIDIEIVQNGWEWVYPNSDSRVLRDAEARARSQETGLWGSDSPMPPWEWRKGGR